MTALDVVVGSDYGMRLLAHHQALLRESSISPDTAAARGYVSVDTKTSLATLGFADFQQRVPALLLPVHDVQGNVVTYQLRPDEPRVVDGNLVKYETPRGSRLVIDVPPIVRDALGNPEQPLIITEGVRKADAAASHGLACIDLLGVWSWKRDGAPLTCWDAIALDGRLVYVAFDSDVVTKPEVEKALRGLARMLTVRGADVFAVTFPSIDEAKVGLDDWLAAGHDVDELHDLAQRVVDDGVTDYRDTDVGNAARLVAAHGHELRYAANRGSWLHYDGRRWQQDDRGVVVELAKSVVANMARAALDEPDEATRKAKVTWALRSESDGRIRAMVNLAKTVNGIPVMADELDADPWLLNVDNGTVDLRTGELRTHRPGDLITKLAGCEYDAAATAPTFAKFLDDVVPDAGAQDFLQRFVGYCLTGVTSEQVLLFWLGVGANGKTTLQNVLLALLGDYAKQGDPDLLLHREQSAHPTGKADLQGARLITLSEVDDGRRLAESTVKQLTGSDPIKARFMRQDFFTFNPTHKVIMSTNHRPVIRGTDHAIWRRVRLLKFGTVIADHAQDRYLDDKLRKELPGILNWAVDGCRKWRENGLTMPEYVKNATASYRADMDVVGTFITECCVVGEPHGEAASDLYDAYVMWATMNDEAVESKTAFGTRLGERGHDKARGSGGRIYRHGIKLNDGTRAALATKRATTAASE